MSRQHSLLGVFVCMLLLMAAMFYPTTDTFAQDICGCSPDQEQNATLTICVGGMNRTVIVAYCNKNYCPPERGVQPCNPDNLPINARTIIRKVCVTDGGPIIADPQVIMNATVAAMGICCSGYHFFPPCQDPQAPFLWLVTTPKCVRFDVAAQCVYACDNTPCCTHLVRFTQTTTGECITDVLHSCDDPVGCEADCIRLECRYPVECCW